MAGFMDCYQITRLPVVVVAINVVEMHPVFEQLIQLKAFLETEAGFTIYTSSFLTLIKLCHLTDSQ